RTVKEDWKLCFKQRVSYCMTKMRLAKEILHSFKIKLISIVGHEFEKTIPIKAMLQGINVLRLLINTGQ
ncbi:MAG: hypothetical protein IKX58_06220, partial [Clostridia bacterium]|nr:hypothetical protein [Clostridia bacterium]